VVNINLINLFIFFKGIRSKLIATDFSEFLPDDLEKELKDTA